MVQKSNYGNIRETATMRTGSLLGLTWRLLPLFPVPVPINPIGQGLFPRPERVTTPIYEDIVSYLVHLVKESVADVLLN